MNSKFARLSRVQCSGPRRRLDDFSFSVAVHALAGMQSQLVPQFLMRFHPRLSFYPGNITRMETAARFVAFSGVGR